MREEHIGEAYIFGGAFLWGLFPVITTLALVSLPSLTALAWAEAFAALFFAAVLTVRSRWKEVLSPAALPDILYATGIIGIGFYVLTFWGISYTSPGNVAIIELTEVFFAYLLFNMWHKETFSVGHVIGALCMVFGAMLVLYPNTTNLNPGDILILAAAAIAPFGNYFSRRARTKVSSETIMFIRSALSSAAIFLIAALIGKPLAAHGISVLLLLAVNGVLLLGLSKIFWIEAIHRISVTKANALSSITPLVTLAAAYAVFGTSPTWFQLCSIAPISAGVFLLSRSAQQPTAP